MSQTPPARTVAAISMTIVRPIARIAWPVERHAGSCSPSRERSARAQLVLPVYVPTALLALGQGLLLPTLPAYAPSGTITHSPSMRTR